MQCLIDNMNIDGQWNSYRSYLLRRHKDMCDGDLLEVKGGHLAQFYMGHM